MTEKRFIPIFDGTDKRVVGAKDNGKIISFMTNKRYIMFNGVIVKEFEVNLPNVECGIDGVKVNGELIE